LVIPLTVGGIALANSKDPQFLKSAIDFGGLLSIPVFLFTLWSVIANWPEGLDYSSASAVENLRLSEELKRLACQFANPPADFDVRYTELKTLDEVRNAADIRRNISGREKIFGHRAALVQFRRACDLCKVVPDSTKMEFWYWKRCPRCGGRKK
jgi:mobilome CxxCx(11)CxxC protein